MAYCIQCGKELVENAKFCAACGTAIDAPQKKIDEQRKTVYDGQLHKCPNCGEMLDAFVTICPICKYELRGTDITSYVHEFSLKLENTEDAVQRIELIKNFYVPNTKEDIYEFFILAAANISVVGYDIDAWMTKFEQTYLKAKVAFAKSEELKYIEEIYSRTKALNKKATRAKKVLAVILFSLGLVMIMGGFIIDGFAYEWWQTYSDAFAVIGIIGFIPFIAGLVLLIASSKKKLFYRRNRK